MPSAVNISMNYFPRFNHCLFKSYVLIIKEKIRDPTKKIKDSGSESRALRYRNKYFRDREKTIAKKDASLRALSNFFFLLHLKFS